MIGQTGFHCWRDAQRLVNPAEVVVKKVHRDLMRMVLKLLTESIGQPREAAHPHPHGEVLPLNIASANVLGIGVATDHLHVSSNAFGWTVTALVGIGRSAVY